MIRNDGKYVIYILQFWAKLNAKKYEWHYAGDGAQFCGPGDFRDEPRVQFTACGDCWQETGVRGTYDYETAVKYLLQCVKHSNDKKLRIARLEIFQRTSGVIEMKYVK
jgi:hypothetical protein